jgi:hypothetical protein
MELLMQWAAVLVYKSDCKKLLVCTVEKNRTINKNAMRQE